MLPAVTVGVLTLNADTLISRLLDEARRLFLHPKDPRFVKKARRFKQKVIKKWGSEWVGPSKDMRDQARARVITALGFHMMNNNGPTEDVKAEFDRHLHTHATRLVKTAQRRLKKAQGGYIGAGGVIPKAGKYHDMWDHSGSGALPTFMGELHAIALNYAREGKPAAETVETLKGFTKHWFDKAHTGGNLGDAKDHPSVDQTLRMSRVM